MAGKVTDLSTTRGTVSQNFSIRVRGAARDDVAAVAKLAHELALHVADPDPGLDTAALVEICFAADPWCEIFVAEFNEEIVGFACFCRRFEAHTRQCSLWVSDLVVTRHWRGRGIGRSLLDAVKARGRELGATTIGLEVWHANQSAMTFYSQNGSVRLDDRFLLQIELAG